MNIVKWIGNFLLLGGTLLVAVWPETYFFAGFIGRVVGDICWTAVSAKQRDWALLSLMCGFLAIDSVGTFTGA